MSALLKSTDENCWMCVDEGIGIPASKKTVCNSHRFVLWALDEVVAIDQWAVFRAIWPDKAPAKNRWAGPAIRDMLKGMEARKLVSRVPKRGWVRTAEGSKVLIVAAPPVTRHAPTRQKTNGFYKGDLVSFPWVDGHAVAVLPVDLSENRSAVLKMEGTGKTILLWAGALKLADENTTAKRIVLVK